MNKKTMYVVGAVVVLAIIAGVGFYTNKSGTPSGASPIGGSQSPTSMKELLAKGGSQKCTFSNNIDGLESSGVVYMASGRMRTDFVAKMANGETTDSHMLLDGENTYLWGNQMPQGIKMNINMMTTQAGAQAQANGSVDLDQKMNYNCDNWSADQGQFNLPSGVTFMDLSTVIPGVNAGASAGATY
jgi:hypothetical protein